MASRESVSSHAAQKGTAHTLSRKAAASTLDDSTSPVSSTARELRRPYEAQTPTKYRKPLETRATSATSSLSSETPLRTHARSGFTAPLVGGRHSTRSSTPWKPAPSSTPSKPSQPSQQPRVASPTNTVTSIERDFQYPSDLPTVRVRYVNVAQRSAFGVPSLPSLEEWERAAAASTKRRKISPSYRYLVWLHKLHNGTVIRQVQFSPSTSRDADYFYSYESMKQLVHQNGTNSDDGVGRTTQNDTAIRDGRYRTIDPLASWAWTAATTDTSRIPPPRLSHQKLRLPNRADVGFPNATALDVARKQDEIRHETAWEESSPRLALLVTSDDLGTIVEPEYEKAAVASEQNSWYFRHGCPGIPPFGKALALAKARNARHFGRPEPHRGSAAAAAAAAAAGGSTHPFSLLCGPDPCSMLAPPLESTYSPSQGWRPRPFHDRPAGMHYCVAWPLAVTLPDSYNQEKLLCSLTLYTLPPRYKDRSHLVTAAAAAAHHGKKQGQSSPPAFGKMSEEWWFPAGDWSGSARHNGKIDAERFQSWMDHKQKAVFSYDPFNLGMESKKPSDAVSDLPGSIYLVVQVYGSSDVSEMDASPSAAPVLHPISFGITKFFSTSTRNGMEWPDGQRKELELYAYPASFETQGSFVELLWGVLYHRSNVTTALDDSSSSTLGEDLLSVQSSVGDVSLQSKRKGLGTLLFRSPKRSQTPPPRLEHRRSASVSSAASKSRQTSLFTKLGRVQLFLASLQSDFFQALLSSPAVGELESKTTARAVPRMLVDVSGDFAVLLESNHVGTGGTLDDVVVNKRSNLLRLPIPDEPAGYCASGEFREVLLLPARPDKHYDVDSHLSPSRAFINHLYLYPRLLRVPPDVSGVKRLSRLTVRVRILHSAVSDNGMSHPILCFHNPAPWCGSSLLDSSFTRVSGDLEKVGVGDVEVGLPLHDEIKIRLPEILDGTYRFEFTLFSMDSNAKLSQVSEASVPLTSSASLRDTGLRVATVIPNGKHRLELGEYQLHLETRLVSSIHTGDPSVAAALSDHTKGRELCVEKGDNDVKSQSSFSLPEICTSSHGVWSSSSESTLTAFFQALICTHLQVFIEPSEEQSLSTRHLHSLVEIISKVRSMLMPGEVDCYRFSMFIKTFMDLFDEASLGNSLDVLPVAESQHDFVEPTEPVEKDSADLYRDDESNGGKSDEKQSFGEIVRTGDRKQPKRRRSTLEKPGTPFSRVAFGASKTDRMRAEAELRHGSRHWASFFDDDETIATAPSIYSGSQRTETRVALSVEVSPQRQTTKSALVSSLQDDNSIVRSSLPDSTNASLPDDEKRSLGEIEFVKRVRTAASFMLAPCVAPSLTNALQKNGAAKSKLSFLSSDGETEPSSFVNTAMCLCSPGSDADDDNTEVEAVQRDDKSAAASASRNVEVKPILVLTSADVRTISQKSAKRKVFMYERLIALCVEESRIYSDDQSHHLTEKEHGVRELCSTLDFLLPLCLKSIVLRFNTEKGPGPVAKALLDDGHMLMFTSFIGAIVRGIVDEALESSSHDSSMKRAFKSSTSVVDFLVGLLCVIDANHIAVLVETYFTTFRDIEKEPRRNTEFTSRTDSEQNESMLRAAQCCRELRLHAVESLATLPSFVALNFPMKFKGYQRRRRNEATTWLHQHVENKAGVSPDAARDGRGKRQNSGWLAKSVIDEALSICALSCRSVIEETMLHMELSRGDSTARPSALKKRDGLGLHRGDLLTLQSIAIHAINVVYELVIRRHALDRRFQSESARSRIAALLAIPILDQSISSARWLAKLDATHKVRSFWLLSFAYVLQEAPEALICDFVRSCCNIEHDLGLHRFVRLLRLSSATFQSFLDLKRYGSDPSENELALSPWLLQESFNTICATAIVVVDVCICCLQHHPDEKRLAMQGILDLLLAALTSPQSSVTQLRAVGGALQILEHDVDAFVEATGSSLQHWARIVLGLMNSTSLSVRSIAVDFVVSLFSSAFQRHGSIDSLLMVFVTVLPEVVAREIALYSVGGHVSHMQEVAKAVWPIRRAIADLGEASPADDDRVDPQLVPVITSFCRACQAVVDGVLLELRLRGSELYVVGVKLLQETESETVFDSNEESLFEASSFFCSESAPVQKIRWLLTLKSLHVSNTRWVEAAESLVLCARTICSAIPHLSDVWRPSRFTLWSDNHRSLWLDSVGKEIGCPDRGNAEVMTFAEQFLEPFELFKPSAQPLLGKLPIVTITTMCELLTRVVEDAISLYRKDPSMTELAWFRLEAILRDIMLVSEDRNRQRVGVSSFRSTSVLASVRRTEEDAALRQTIHCIGGLVSGLSQELVSISQVVSWSPRPYFVLMCLSGTKPLRFEESTTIPTFLEWDKPCICRVPNDLVEKFGHGAVTENVCLEFAGPMIKALRIECGDSNVVLRTEPGSENDARSAHTHFDIFPVALLESQGSSLHDGIRHFFHRKGATLVETTVARGFPGVLSRQCSLLTTDITTTKTNSLC